MDSKIRIGQRDFLTKSALFTAGLVAGSTIHSSFSDAQTTEKNNTIMKSTDGQGLSLPKEWQPILPTAL